MKKHGRKEPYTEIGIARIPCVHCGRPSTHQFQICFDGRKYRPVCKVCDIIINWWVCIFFGLSIEALGEYIINAVNEDE